MTRRGEGNGGAAAAVGEAAGAAPATVEASRPVLLFRRGRGRVGGSTGCDLYSQRARHQGRRVKPLDGDLRSGTLSRLYTEGGDRASCPPTEELPDQKAWLLRELDAMAEDGVSRVVDFGGGERVVAEFVRDLPLAEFCRSQGIRLVSAYFLGPDMEDFEHVVRITRSGDLAAENVPLVPNEGVIQQGQTTLGAFDPILAHPDFEALLKAGARAAVLTRLACMRRLREDGLGFYRTAYPSAGTRPASATMQHMTAAWIERHEAALAEESAVGWLP